jgi:hypothetical protein
MGKRTKMKKVEEKIKEKGYDWEEWNKLM